MAPEGRRLRADQGREGRYIFAATAGQQIHLTKDLALVSVLRDRVWEWDIFPVPEKRGKWGVIHRATLKTRDHTSGRPVRVAWEVKAYEDVRMVVLPMS